ncbi:MAG: transcription termination/antitermination protein NusA [bacterium]|nr:transcription termination/antitermination protein NusA [bacterium]
MENLNVDFLPILEQIERDKGIARATLVNMIEQALVSTFKRYNPKVEDVEANINIDSGQITLHTKKRVVQRVTDASHEVSLSEAKLEYGDVKVGDEIEFKIDTSNFGRIAAQTAKQVLIQKIRETEKENLYNEYKEKEGTVISGCITKMINNTAIFEIGKMEAILPIREQIENETYSQGNYMKVYITKVELTPRGPKVIVSRKNPEILGKLLELEVPEVYDGTIEVKVIARNAGNRSKIAVSSHNVKVDPVGSVVGVRGARVRAVTKEFGDEKIDLVPYSDNSSTYIENALKPALIDSIFLDEANHNAEVVVADDQLPLAIGKGGSNVKLAARLTGWHLDIKTNAQRQEARAEESLASLRILENIEGINKNIANTLLSAGYADIPVLKEATKEDLMGLQGVGEKTALKIIDAVKALD